MDRRYDRLISPAFALDAAGVYYATARQILRADDPPLTYNFANAFIPSTWAAIGAGCEAV